MSDETPEEAEEVELDKMMAEAVTKISEHADSVTIFATKKLEDGKGFTYRAHIGRGDYYARYGAIKAWVIGEDSHHASRGGKTDDED